MKISTAIFRQEALGDQRRRVCSKSPSSPEASRREGRSPFCARSVLAVREHEKRARTPLAAFFNRPLRGEEKNSRLELSEEFTVGCTSGSRRIL